MGTDSKKVGVCATFGTFHLSLMLTSSETVICRVNRSARKPVPLPRGKEMLTFLSEVRVVCTGQEMKNKLRGLLICPTIAIQLLSNKQSSM
ncbi:unnamed protein product [Prunus armeniaca]